MPISLALPPVEFKNIINFSSETSRRIQIQYQKNQDEFEKAQQDYVNTLLRSSGSEQYNQGKLDALKQDATDVLNELKETFSRNIQQNNNKSSDLNKNLDETKTNINNQLTSSLSNTSNTTNYSGFINSALQKVGDVITQITNLSYDASHNGIKTVYNKTTRVYPAQTSTTAETNPYIPVGVNLNNFVIDFKNNTLGKDNKDSVTFAKTEINNIKINLLGNEGKDGKHISGSGFLDKVSEAHTAIQNVKDTLNNVLAAQNNVGNNDGQKEAYKKANEEIEKRIKGIQGDILNIARTFTTDDIATAKERLKQAQQALQESIANLQAALYLEKMQQKAFQTLRTENQTLSKLSSSFALNTSKLNFASKLSTNSRLAKLSNPKAKDLQFAQWIESIKHKHLADNATHLSNNTNTSSHQSNNSSNNINAGYLSKIIYDYDSLRFKHSHNVWGNIGTILGNSQGINSASGVVSVGYDTWIRNMILGIYGSYSYTSNAIANVDSTNSSHNGDIGVYGRIFGGNNEFDINLGENIGLNHLALKDSVGRDTPITLEDNYMSLQTHLDLTYGYVFDLHKGWFSKPFLGVNYNYGYNSAMQAKDSVMSMGFNDFQTHFVSANMGLEIRKYFNNNESYFFVAPAFYQGVLLSNNQVIETRIYDRVFSSSVSEFNKNSNLDTSFLLKVGGEWKIKENIYVNVSAGAKLGNINQYGMLNVGGRYSFGNADSNLSRALREKAKLDKAKAKQDKELKEKQEKAAKAKEKAAKEAKAKADKQAKEAKEKLEKDNKAKEKAAKALKEKQEKDAKAKEKAAKEAKEKQEKAAKEAKAKADKQAKEAKEKQEKAAKEAKAKAEKDAKAKSSKGSSK